MDLPLSGKEVSGSGDASTAAAVAEGALGGDPESIDVPDEVEDILGASEITHTCNEPLTDLSAAYFLSYLLQRIKMLVSMWYPMLQWIESNGLVNRSLAGML